MMTIFQEGSLEIHQHLQSLHKHMFISECFSCNQKETQMSAVKPSKQEALHLQGFF